MFPDMHTITYPTINVKLMEVLTGFTSIKAAAESPIVHRPEFLDLPPNSTGSKWKAQFFLSSAVKERYDREKIMAFKFSN